MSYEFRRTGCESVTKIIGVVNIAAESTHAAEKSAMELITHNS
jgi:hypothetical protein